MPVDVDNKGVIYHKVFGDVLKRHLIPDDSSEYINDTGRIKWIKTDTTEPILKIIISKSSNEFPNEYYQ
jgi:hypothetical protein